jgi:hypothetical protein
MFALALDVPPLPLWSTPVLAYRHEASDRPDQRWSHVNLAIRYEAGNALTTGLHVSAVADDWLVGFQPRTGLGKRLLALRQAYVASGGRLMSAAALDDELRQRRGGVDDA